MILLGEVIYATEAQRIGLANRVVADQDLEASANELAARLAAQPPLAVQGARRAIEAACDSDPDTSLTVAVEQQIRCLASADFAEARQAMIEGRAPVWQGR